MNEIELPIAAPPKEGAGERRPWGRPELKSLKLEETAIRAYTGNDGVGASTGFNYSAS